MSEAARKSYFFLPPGASWSSRPPEVAGFYWVLPALGEHRSSAAELVHFDPAHGATSATRSLLGAAGAATPIPLAHIASWWPIPVAPPPVPE